ncbi:hypothetical protein [Kribbella italica]|uniref:Uncharacterized protein n=1 Tax=Kribbella italica TaxID=1540520 RepID=A0A7W9JG48_9ACTN|nr:hypothetical protein [Kribbella italica]MBB5841195.1 hypothetical protein [Kribbella italica]
MVTSGVPHLARTRWLRRAGAAAVATAVLGLGSTGLAVAVLTARQPDTSSTTASTPNDQGASDQDSTSGLGQADQDAPAQGGSNGS